MVQAAWTLAVPPSPEGHAEQDRLPGNAERWPQQPGLGTWGESPREAQEGPPAGPKTGVQAPGPVSVAKERRMGAGTSEQELLRAGAASGEAGQDGRRGGSGRAESEAGWQPDGSPALGGHP